MFEVSSSETQSKSTCSLDDASVVGVDIDNVLAETDPAVRLLISKFYGIQVEQSRISEWDYHLSVPISVEQERFIFSQLHSRYIQELQILPGARETLRDLAKKVSIWLITGRPVTTARDTEQWLRTNMVPYDRLVFSPTKVDLAQKLDILIEDNWTTALELAERGTFVLLVDYPWNRDRGDNPLIIRVAGWSDIRSELRAILGSEKPGRVKRA